MDSHVLRTVCTWIFKIQIFTNNKILPAGKIIYGLKEKCTVTGKGHKMAVEKQLLKKVPFTDS